MSTLLLGFIGPQEIIIILFMLFVPGIVLIIVLVALFRRRNRKRYLETQPKQPESKLNKQPNSILSETNFKDYYPVKEGNKITLIQFDEIIDFSSANNFVFLTDIGGKEYLVDSTLSELETKLPNDFIRIHKSTLVNRNLIAEVKKLENGRFDLVMKCKKERTVSCSKSYNEKVKSIIDF